jgi:hypothetical protein
MRSTRFKLLLPLAVAGGTAIALFAVGGGSAAPQKADGGSPSPGHYQHAPVADFDVPTQLFPDGGNEPSKNGLAISSLTIDNPSTSMVVASVIADPGCNGGGQVITRVAIPAQDTVHLEYAGEPLLAFNPLPGRVDPGWCLEILPDGEGLGNVIAAIVGNTYKV